VRGGSGSTLKPDARPAADAPITSSIRELALVFMIDNSPSMAPKQEKLEQQFPKLSAALKDPATNALPDPRIAIIDSDLGTMAAYYWPVCYAPNQPPTHPDSVTGFDLDAANWGATGGLRLSAFIDEFGPNGMKFSICETDFATVMKEIGDKVATTLGPAKGSGGAGGSDVGRLSGSGGSGGGAPGTGGMGGVSTFPLADCGPLTSPRC
jgi:hypothetical protein